jgi:uncharacterized membrane protein YkvA (DUF1232 family)
MSINKQAEDIHRLSRDLRRKLRGAAVHVPFAEDAVAIYYCALDRATPIHVRGAIMAALAYFILPVDTLPDFMPVLGFTDDAAVLAATLKLVAVHVRDEHRRAARRALGEIEAADAA